MAVETHMKLCVTEPYLLKKKKKKKKKSPKIGKWASKMVKNRVFLSLLKSLVINFYFYYFLLFSNENLYCLLCSCTTPIFGKTFVPEIWTKMFSANQIAGFFNQPYLQNESMKKPHFLHVDTYSHKFKVDRKCSGWPWSYMDVASLVMEV